MKFRINSCIFEKFPELKIGILIAKNINNRDSGGEDVLSLIRAKESSIREDYSRHNLSENPKIKSWREAYSSFGAKPKKYKCSVENLYRMILENKDIRHINNLVDVYNYISIRHMIPIGGDDIDKVEGDIELTIAKGDEKFIELGSDELKNPKPEEIIYRDDKEVLCRRFNWKECEKTKMTEDTKNVCLAAEALPPFTKEELKTVLQELSEWVKKMCGGEIKGYVLDEDVRESEIS
ncbi:hypothetical protein JXB41_01975 [Candidatus Woesearchaeota archaeon]|nr:hypothetical protein [Candidatus Woesearchaeota archaeon]